MFWIAQTLRLPAGRKYLDRPLLARVALLALTLAGAAAVLARTTGDPDLWGHLRFGMDALRTLTVARADPYSFLTAGQTWINHEWLSEVIFALAWSVGGILGLTVLKLAVAMVVVVIALGYLLRHTCEPLRAATLLAPAIILLAPELATIRPQMFTMLATVVLLRCVLAADQGRYQALWLLPPMFLVWANLHGGFLAGLTIFGIWGLGHLATRPAAWRRLAPPFLASLLATCVNPYGPTLLAFLLRTATVSRPEVTEWQPLALASVEGATYLGLLAVSLLGVVFSRRRRHVPDMLLLAALAIMPLLAVRHTPFLAFGAIFLAGPHVLDAWDRARSGKPVLKASDTVLTLTAALGAIVLVATSFISLSQIPPDPRMNYPAAAVQILDTSRVSANLATEFNWGEYLIWHLGPRVKVSIDGRRETTYSPAAYQTALDFIYGQGNWDAILAPGQADLALVKSGSATFNLLRLKPGWVSVFADSGSALFARQTFSGLPQLQQTSAAFHLGNAPLVFP